MAILFLSALIMVVNLNIYQEWGSKLPYRAISTFIDYPYEAYISASSSAFFLAIHFIFDDADGGVVFIKQSFSAFNNDRKE